MIEYRMISKENSICDFIDDKIIKEKEIKCITSSGKFYSKKNNVNKIKITFLNGSKQFFVVKEYIGDDWNLRKDKETYILSILQKSTLGAPKIFLEDKNLLILEFLGIETLLDHICACEDNHAPGKLGQMEFPDSKSCIGKIKQACLYIYEFNGFLKKITGLSYILSDMNLRNFIPGDKIYRVDFEDCNKGQVEEDIGKFIAFLLTYDPPFTEWKLKASDEIRQYCVKNFNLDLQRINIEVEKELDLMKSRRK